MNWKMPPFLEQELVCTNVPKLSFAASKSLIQKKLLVACQNVLWVSPRLEKVIPYTCQHDATLINSFK